MDFLLVKRNETRQLVHCSSILPAFTLKAGSGDAILEAEWVIKLLLNHLLARFLSYLITYSAFPVEWLLEYKNLIICSNIKENYSYHALNTTNTCTCTCSYVFFQDPFCHVSAVVKGFLTRRLLKSEKIEDIVITIKVHVCASFPAT